MRDKFGKPGGGKKRPNNLVETDEPEPVKTVKALRYHVIY